MRSQLIGAFAGLSGIALGGLCCVSDPGEAGMRTVPRREAAGAEPVRRALAAPTEEGRVEALVAVLGGEDIAASIEAMELLAGMGPGVVPRLVSEMRRSRNNWLIGGALVRMGSEAVRPLVELMEQAESETVVDCIYLLGEIQDPRAVPTLVRYLEDPRDAVRMHAVTALLQIGGYQPVAAVLSRLAREDQSTEGFIVDCLLRYGRKSVEPLLQSMASGDPRIRREAAFLLGGLGDLRAVEPLMRALGDASPAVRRNAAYALGELAGLIQEPRVVIQLLAERLSDSRPEVADEARSALVHFGTRAVPLLLEGCRSRNASVVLASLNALREIGDPEAEETMIDLLDHRDPHVRLAAVAGLLSTGTSRSVEPLLNALRDDDLRWLATLALEKLGAENPRLFFSAAPDDATMSLRTQILVRLGPSVVPALLEFLRDENVGRRAAAVWLLGEIGDPAGAGEVARLLSDPHLGWLAGSSLHAMGEPGLAELVRYVRSPPTDRGAVEAVDALARFQDPRAWDVLEEVVKLAVPREARVRATVLISAYGDTDRIERVRSYLQGEGQVLWPEVEAAIQAEQQIR